MVGVSGRWSSITQSDQTGEWLLAEEARAGRSLAVWMARLWEFDRDGEFAADGFLSAVDWLCSEARMARSTAYERVRVATELARRPVIADAFGDGRLSYSDVRAITRAVDPDREVDEAFVAVAAAGSHRDVMVAVASYEAYRDQDRPPSERIATRRGLVRQRRGDGTVRYSGTLTEAEAAEFDALLERFRRPAEEPPVETVDAAESPVETGGVGESPVETDGEGDGRSSTWWDDYALTSLRESSGRADAFCDLLRHVAAGSPDEQPGDDRYLLHLILAPDRTATLLDGTGVPAAEAEAIGCDGAVIDHRTGPDGETVALGRHRRRWSRAQRRAAAVRDGGHCRFPGCSRRVTAINHLRWWRHGGTTDLDNGLLLCSRHHTLVHEHHYAVHGNPNQALVFARPDGRIIGITRPVGRQRPGPERDRDRSEIGTARTPGP